jgi:hypothetical protein
MVSRGVAGPGQWLLVTSVAVSIVGAGLTGCGDDSDESDAAADAPESTEDTVDGGAESAEDTAKLADEDVAEPELRQELVDMMEADQDERTGVAETWNDEERTERLGEIIDEYGWPTWDLVGEDGATAAWLIAQHSDFDVGFQQDALELLREAVEADKASPGDLAYLEDRVALNTDEPQTYGTQIGGCSADGDVEPAVPIDDPDQVDERRAEAGLEPLADYYAEICTLDG